jgi:hypothetical protein
MAQTVGTIQTHGHLVSPRLDGIDCHDCFVVGDPDSTRVEVVAEALNVLRTNSEGSVNSTRQKPYVALAN